MEESTSHHSRRETCDGMACMSHEFESLSWDSGTLNQLWAHISPETDVISHEADMTRVRLVLAYLVSLSPNSAPLAIQLVGYEQESVSSSFSLVLHRDSFTRVDSPKVRVISRLLVFF